MTKINIKVTNVSIINKKLTFKMKQRSFSSINK